MIGQTSFFFILIKDEEIKEKSSHIHWIDIYMAWRNKFTWEAIYMTDPTPPHTTPIKQNQENNDQLQNAFTCDFHNPCVAPTQFLLLCTSCGERRILVLWQWICCFKHWFLLLHSSLLCFCGPRLQHQQHHHTFSHVLNLHTNRPAEEPFSEDPSIHRWGWAFRTFSCNG